MPVGDLAWLIWTQRLGKSVQKIGELYSEAILIAMKDEFRRRDGRFCWCGSSSMHHSARIDRPLKPLIRNERRRGGWCLVCSIVQILDNRNINLCLLSKIINETRTVAGKKNKPSNQAELAGGTVLGHYWEYSLEVEKTTRIFIHMQNAIECLRGKSGWEYVVEDSEWQQQVIREELV